MQADGNGVVYRIDERDTVVFVDDAWDRFAAANAGDRVFAARVLNHSLWDFVLDPTTRSLYKKVLDRVRSGSPVAFSFRCDAPDGRRLMEMQVARMSDGHVEFRTRTVEEEDRPYLALLDASLPRSSDLVKVCGWCSRISVGRSWIEIEDALGHLRLLEEAAPPMLSHGLCERCHDDMSATLAES